MNEALREAPPAETRRKTASVLAALAAPFLILLWHRQSDHHDLLKSDGPPSGVRDGSTVAKVLLRLASQDWLLLGYLVTLTYLVASGSGPRRPMALACSAAELALFVGVLWFVRGERPQTAVSAFVYRLGILVALLGTFFELQWILPAASGPALDASLHALDLRVFGVEPAEAWDRFVRPATTEWFSFFYYGYFIIVALHVLPALFFGRRERLLIPFGFGFLWLYCIGHVVYTIVPAYGPYAHLAFRHPLEGGLWWPLVKQTVASVDGSLRTDVFPSLHTAGPSFLTFYSIQHRRYAPYRYTWLPLAFCTTQIVIATMFLRWHYLIDICAGVALAASAIVVGKLALWWDEARRGAGGPQVFPALALPGRLFSAVRR